MSKRTSQKFLLVDDTHLLEVHGLQRVVHQAVKHPEPVIRMDAPWDEKNEMFNLMNVLYDEEERLFKMWYVVMRYDGQLSDGSRKMAYATSPDGIHWEKPILGRVEVNGSTQNNYLIPEMGSFACSILQDRSDVPARRYKMIFSVAGRETAWAKFHSPLNLAYSADGIVWDRPAHVNPVLRGISDDCFSFFYDPDRRRYVLLTRRVPNLPRDISQYESPDLVNWEDKGRVLVPGDEWDPPEMYNFYYVAPFRYEDFYLGMLSTLYTHPLSEGFESFHQPSDYRTSRFGHVDIQLAYSRDGQSWRRPADRSPVIPVGEPGAPDDGAVYPAQNPFVVNGETWIYYVATRHRHSWWHVLEQYERDRSVQHVACGMLAKMPEDGWVSLEAGNRGGTFTTQPFGLPHELTLNADATGGSIQVEVVTPYGEVVPGLSRADCRPVTSRSTRHVVQWKGSSDLAARNQEFRGGVLYRFYLENAKVYSFSLAFPDPTGEHERWLANARWLETIKHKSDGFSGRGTEPAGGLPPYTGRAIPWD